MEVLSPVLYYFGIGIVGLTHLWMLIFPKSHLTTPMQHSLANLVAVAALIAALLV